MKTRAAIYARMSTDKQAETSPADQVAQCRAYAEREGWSIVEALIVEDAGVSGASRHNRPALLELVARIDEWDVLLCFDFSRLARNEEDFGWLKNRLQLHKRTAVEASGGLDLFNVGAGVMGVLNAEYLKKLAADTHRGLSGRHERRLSAGGRPFGYRSVRLHPEDPKGGTRWEVDDNQAKVVREIFNLYLRGDGYRAIANRLNAGHIPSPRGRGWAVSALHALLRNEIYRGEYLWNRSEWVKDHETGRRVRHERPESEWLREHDETWRIVSDETWEAVQQRMHSPNRKRSGKARDQGRYLFSGLLACGVCGGGFWAIDRRGIFGCGARKDRGREACACELRIEVADLETRIVGALRDQVLTEENVARVADRALEIVQEQLGAQPPDPAERLASLDVQIERAVELAVRSGGVEAVARKLKVLEAEREGLVAQHTETPARIDVGGLRTRALELAADLRATFTLAPTEIRGALRMLLGDDRIRVSPDADRGFRVDGILGLPWGPQTKLPGSRSSRAVDVVAGTGFEPATCGL